MKLSKKEYKKRLSYLSGKISVNLSSDIIKKCDNYLDDLEELLDDVLSNNAIQQEELENFMIVWDSKENKWKKLFEINEIFYYEEFGCDHAIRFKYEENRYFRKEIR